jgi:hypothetical protein
MFLLIIMTEGSIVRSRVEPNILIQEMRIGTECDAIESQVIARRKIRNTEWNNKMKNYGSRLTCSHRELT